MWNPPIALSPAGRRLLEGVSKLLIWYPLLRTCATSFVGGTMITQVLHCPYCHGTDIVRHGLSPEGKQRCRCRACLECASDQRA